MARFLELRWASHIAARTINNLNNVEAMPVRKICERVPLSRHKTVNISSLRIRILKTPLLQNTALVVA